MDDLLLVPGCEVVDVGPEGGMVIVEEVVEADIVEFSNDEVGKEVVRVETMEGAEVDADAKDVAFIPNAEEELPSGLPAFATFLAAFL